MADYKKIEEEDLSMPPRDPSLEDFEKLENVLSDQDHLAADFLLSGGSSGANTTPPKYDLLADLDDSFKFESISQPKASAASDNKSMSQPPPYEEEGYPQPSHQLREDDEDPFGLSLGSAAPTKTQVPPSAPRLLQFDQPPAYEYPAKPEPAHPPPASKPIDSGYVPSPVEEEREEEKHDKKVAAAGPKIAEAPTKSGAPIEKNEETKQELPKKDQPIIFSTTTNKTMSTEVSTTSGSASGCPFSPSALFDPNRLNPFVNDLVYWKDPKKSGAVFGLGLVFLISLRYFSLISVISHLALAVISGTLAFRIYKTILQAVQKSTDGHPFKEFLEQDISIPQEKVHESADIIVKHTITIILKLRSLFLVEDIIDSVKLGIALWCLTYLGCCFNGLTLITLGFISVFSLPKVYETNKTQIDQYLNLVNTQVSGILSMVKSKIPFGQKKKDQ